MQPMNDQKKDLSVFRPKLTATGIAFQGQDIGQIYGSGLEQLSARASASAISRKVSNGIVIRGGAGMFFDTPNANPFLDNRPGNERSERT